MMAEEGVRRLLANWTTGRERMEEMGNKDGALLASGYVGALELVLNGSGA